MPAATPDPPRARARSRAIVWPGAPASRRRPALLAGLVAAFALLPPVPARAQSPFVAKVDRSQVTLGEAILYQITLSLNDGRAEAYRAPDFRGFRVLSEQPSQSTEVQMGGGTSLIRTVYTWNYELAPTQSGRLVIGPAHVRANGRELRTIPVPITVQAGDIRPPGQSGSAAPPPAPPPRMRRSRSPFADLFNMDDPVVPAPSGGGGAGSFLRAAADKTKVYVGEQVVVEWLLYLTDRQDKYQALTEPRTDGFWSEELTVPHNQGSLALTQQMYEGRLYLVAPLARKALFPLQSGNLNITPLESEISQVDFFGRTLRTERLKAQPLQIEVLPLPAGKPEGFDPANVGLFNIDARVDRNKVGVGEAVTLLVTVSGQGNIRKLSVPHLGALTGWKTYEPKTEVKIQNETGIAGTKSIEYLLLPERPGVTTLPPLTFAFFDPAGRRYVTQKTHPLKIEVSGEARGGRPALATGAGSLGGLENVLPAEIRPPRTRPALRRDLGTTFYQSRAFLWTLVAPPGLFGLSLMVGRLRERWGQDTERGRRRKTRRLIRDHLRAAEGHLKAGRTAPFYIEIDRVLSEVLTARLRRPIAGLPRDELATVITDSGLGKTVATRVLHELDASDRARFAPGTVNNAEMRASLERAADLILRIEKAPARAERASA